MADAPDIDAGLADGTYKEAYVPPLSGGVDDRGEYINAAYYVPFEHRHEFIRKMQGVPEYSGGSSPPTGGVGAWNPATPYERPDAPGLYAFACQWESVGTLEVGADSFTTSDVLMMVQFRTPMWPIGGDAGALVWDPLSIGGTFDEQQALLWATQDIDSSTEYIERPQGSMFLEDYPGPGEYTLVDVPEPVPVSISDILVTYMRVPYIPSFLEGLKGGLNDRVFLGCGIGELYFANYRSRMQSWVGGFRTRSVEIHLRKRPNGVTWNMRLGPDGHWYVMKNAPAAEGEETFPLVNMNRMLLLGYLAS